MKPKLVIIAGPNGSGKTSVTLPKNDIVDGLGEREYWIQALILNNLAIRNKSANFA
jgi:predicted ABC-type ATPase